MISHPEAEERMTYGIKVHILDKKSMMVEAIIMSNIHDHDYFSIISKRGQPKVNKIKINNLTQVSFDKERGLFGNKNENHEHFLTLFMLAESINLVFDTRPDLEAFLIFINVILLDDVDG
jgi:hypothetical protein